MVPVPPALIEDLEKHLDTRVGRSPESLVFTGPKGGPLRYRYFYMTLWRPVLASLGLRAAGVHSLRHSAAARMIGAGWTAKAVQQVLGHRSVAFTLTVYGHLFDSDLDALAARLDDPKIGGARVEIVSLDSVEALRRAAN